MLAKSYRLPHSVSFSNTKSFFTPFFRILVKENTLSHNRFGFVVSKKIDKRAVVRNRIRRILQEAVRQNLTQGSGKDMLFVVRQSFIEEKTTEIFSMVQSALEKIV